MCMRGMRKIIYRYIVDNQLDGKRAEMIKAT